ncbi:SH3 domain-binding protein 5 [Cichlidogyrus casuarinus]|uniref:SH3 domain-binding protein 5 n=1 Tax=Cichlidogyrus casuarinus TaxID=1844966 RepID=A0ABD2QNA6_9PLAT
MGYEMIPASERFAFCLSSILSEVAYFDPGSSDKIISSILDSASTILELIEEIVHSNEKFATLLTFLKQNADNSWNTDLVSAQRVCLYLAPVFMGLLRGLGRIRSNASSEDYSDAGPSVSGIVSSLLPSPNSSRYSIRKMPCSKRDPLRVLSCYPESRLCEASSIFPNFRSLIPQCLYQTLFLNRASAQSMLHFMAINDSSAGSEHNLCLSCNKPRVACETALNNSYMMTCEVACDSWFEKSGSESLFNSIASVFGSRLPHRAALCEDLHATPIYHRESTAFPYQSLIHCMRLIWLVLIRDITHNTEQGK